MPMTKQITQQEIDFIKKRYPNAPSSRSFDPNKIAVSRRRLLVVVYPEEFPKDSDSCYYCSRKVYHHSMPEAIQSHYCIKTIDHLVPKCDGGNHLVVACADCNQLKSSDPADVFLAFIDTPEFKATRPGELMRRAAYRAFKNKLMLDALRMRDVSTGE